MQMCVGGVGGDSTLVECLCVFPITPHPLYNPPTHQHPQYTPYTPIVHPSYTHTPESLIHPYHALSKVRLQQPYLPQPHRHLHPGAYTRPLFGST
jgi:hypothetical protein